MYYSMNYAGNSKTGPIPVTSSSRDTCAPDCQLKGICYGEGGRIGYQWSRLDNNDMATSGDWESLIRKIKALPRFQLWRHNEKGDLPHDKGYIYPGAMDALVWANRYKNGFTYTHHELNGHNLHEIRRAIKAGFTINVSCDTPGQAVEVFKKHQLPTVCVVPEDYPTHARRDDVTITVCPAQRDPADTCATCALCQQANRNFIIAFRAHGIYKKQVNVIARG